MQISQPTLYILTVFLILSCQPTAEDPAEAGPNASATDRPNIILMVADDHGKDALGCYGNPVVRTPALDALAATGFRFDRAFCTTASCSASRSVILSGLHNHANGHYGHQHAYHHFSAFDKVKSLPVLLENEGYRTARVGKYHLAPESVYHFQEVFQASARSPVEMADACADFIRADDPFFLYFCFSDPHRGGGFAEELPHQPDRFGNRPESYPGITEVTYDPDEVLVPPHLTDTPETRAEIAQYYQSISRLDQGVARLMDQLKTTGKFDNTLIIYISDNGMAFPGAKTTLYEAGMQLPCLVKAPGQQEPAVTDAMISWTDLTPTILEIAGAKVADSTFQGRSFVPVLTGDRWERDEIYASHTFHEITMYYPMRVVRGENYKLIMNLASGLEYPFASDLYASKTWQSLLERNMDKLGEKPIAEFLRRPRFELYDLSKDPYETYNLADLPEFREILNGLQRKVQSFQEQTGDPWVYKWEYE
ncbi:sulfatase family protein [Flavilitoribacter nigricans]|uniref:Heparan N-sulfatase n=1 Tax=Flavilitoribacter nigricans (strain ATCC 23147 / DSM 23189 / NBRC 102662 / NCIMB 1420 / SS-2) TaxID=1122177 RepID=A0A2D0N0P2_FLAN2|nr:sulfatase [Flavilitoribacter nigricans]PHN02122.1 heparan N-sulfatase [Flavilitoribacter nigricans DSM 23189 = NBRC 102662]